MRDELIQLKPRLKQEQKTDPAILRTSQKPPPRLEPLSSLIQAPSRLHPPLQD